MQRLLRHSALLAFASLLTANMALAGTTVWLVRPLYPGQEALVERTEKALDKLMPGDARKDSIIGSKELSAALKGKKIDTLPCFSADSRCPDPIDAFVGMLNYDRIVLIQGGQDEAGFKFKVTAYEPKGGKQTPASATNAVLERALLGAVAKVVPAASTLEVKSTPVGATVFIDDVKVGTTPLNTQVLPGERVVRLDLKLHQPIEETIVIPIRGTASISKNLEKVAARLVITAAPAGASIAIDGEPLGKDKLDRGILPGKHVIRITAENHKAFEQAIEVKAEEQYVMDKTLEPLPGAVVVDPNHPPTEQGNALVKKDPPVEKTPTELTYERKSYFTLNYEFTRLEGIHLVARRWGTDGVGRTESFTTNSRDLHGGSFEYGTFGKYFGVTVVGLTYLTNAERYAMTVGYEGDHPEFSKGMQGPDFLDPVRIHIVRLRALAPQFRMCFWKFQLSAQAGFELQSGQITGVNDTFYKDGFMLLDALVAARFNARFYIVDGLFLALSANYSWFLGGSTTANGFHSSSSWGANGGIGYGF